MKPLQSPENDQRSAWLKAGLGILDRSGAQALKISALCQALKQTKGAFYHWFGSKEAYEDALLGHWKERYTQAFIQQAEHGRTAAEKLALLARQCIEGVLTGGRLEYEINAWGRRSEAVRQYIEAVYRQRYDYLLHLLGEIHDDPRVVEQKALQLYCLIIGVDFFFKPLDRRQLELMFAEHLQAE